MNVAVLGATGLVGSSMVAQLSEKGVGAENYYLFASEKSVGKRFTISGKPYIVQSLSERSLQDKRIDYALIALNSTLSRKFTPVLLERGATVIDNSSAYRLLSGVPLVVPEVNGDTLVGKSYPLIANPNCSTIQAVVAIKPIADLYKIKRIVFSTYQSVSGGGQKGINDLELTSKGQPPQYFEKPIFSNFLPKIGEYKFDGYTEEEMKMLFETRKILDLPDLMITATCVRVPVKYCHGETVGIEFDEPIALNAIEQALSGACGVVFSKTGYPTALDAIGSDKVFVGRLRRDVSVKYGITFWCVADNVLKGAAANAVSILKLISSDDD